MADYDFNTNAGETVARELLMLFLNTGTTQTPTWSPVGKRVEDSSMEYDWSTETKVDIFGETWTTGKKATVTQTFEPCELDSDDAAQHKIWKAAVVDKNIHALNNMDVLVVHAYATHGTGSGVFAERYKGSSIVPTSLGGEGGGDTGMPISVTFGGERTIGVATVSGKTVTFTED